MKKVIRTDTYQHELNEIEKWIAKDNEAAAVGMWLHIDGQVDKLSDPNFPRKRGRIKGTFELVAHPNYIVILKEDAKTVDVLNVKHAREKRPNRKK